ncbi:MAG: 3-carboxy-cis,cis-muconate cycloisomerase [Nitriliruptorales bacterium]|nr:3-carboxy-cis,cis-muconate cycloisomerase [Nitriliruptorales bacterium]
MRRRRRRRTSWTCCGISTHAPIAPISRRDGTALSQDILFTTPQMAEVFSAGRRLQRMLDVEAALARALARRGMVPDHAADAIGRQCRVEHFDVEAVYREAMLAGTPTIPLVARLVELVDDDARGFVHWGATSQDILDTGLVLQMRDGLDLLLADLVGIGRSCAALAEQHRTSLMPARTLLQHALPTTFGLKAAQWLAAVTAQIARLREVERGLAVQLGGAAGTLAAYRDDGLAVVALLAEELHLPAPALSWHTDRNLPAAVTAAVGLACGTAGKIATDVALLMQTEVGEVAEGPRRGKGGSTTMPHKRNPVDSVAAVAAARLALGAVPVVMGAMIQEHERGAGSWQAEWDGVPAVFRHASAAIFRTGGALAGLEVDVDRMRDNLELTGGAVLAESLATALAPHIGRPAANTVVQGVVSVALSSDADLRAAAHDTQAVTDVLEPAQIDAAFDAAGYLGSNNALIDRALTSFTQFDHDG